MTLPDSIPTGLLSRRPVLPRVFILCVVVACTTTVPSVSAQEQSTELFDGKSLDGWEVIDRDQRWWTVSDGAITGGSLEDKVPHNTFICTKESFQNFDLTLKIRITGASGFINSGIQIRSIRVPNSSEMSGYQVDAGDGWWGKIYDESRRNKVVGQAADLDRVNQAIRKNDWNEFRIRTEGPRIRSWINGVAALDYVEQSASIPLDGQIGIQVHGGGKALVQARDIAIERLPATPGVMTWEQIQRARDVEQDAKKNSAAGPLSPEKEQQSFVVPDGFEVELVASEADGIGKFVTVAFDARGRMWTMTALEYPVDANEDPEASAQLFEDGGSDKVLVFEEPFGEQVSQPTVFADGLVMPLGILPHKDGVYVQYGHDIRFYRDTDGDGKADTHEVILTGFGVQDSHLFPHQFTRTPGGWILTAQGLFNSSTVRRPGDKQFVDGTKEVRFHQCKLARFTTDGAKFEALTAGPNNIWGLTISREGETWLQEANDLGYPLIPYEPGGHYATGSKDRLRAYQPLMPPTLSPPQMGGTGLSGLALADDLDGWPTPWGMKNAKPDSPRHFFVANPITSRIQMIRATVDGERYRYEKLPDFLISRDPKFRPVSIQFGPDGCLYVTDWYNKIISHNEVPRNHPERDKIRGRIWRIRHSSQPRLIPPKLDKLTNSELLAHLGSPNACTASLAWQQIVDRKTVDLIPKLQELVVDRSLAADRRLGALWALEGLSSVATATLVTLTNDTNANIRHEAARISAAQPRSNDEYVAVAKPLVDDPSPRVRAALGDGLRRLAAPDANVIDLMLRLGKAPLPGKGWESYDREFERYMARWAMERNADAVQQLLDSETGTSIPLENRVLATLSLPGARAAVGLSRLVSKLTRPLTAEETRTLAANFNEPEVAATMSELLKSPASRESTLKMLLRLRTDLDTRLLQPSIDAATQIQWSQATSEADRQLALQIAGAFRIQSLDQKIAAYAADGANTDRMKLAALRSLRELGSSAVNVLSQIAVAPGASAEVRSAALAALAESPAEEAALVMAELLIDLNYEGRQSVIERMVTSRSGSLALLAAIEDGDLEPDSLSPPMLETMRELLPDNEVLEGLWNDVAGAVRQVVRLGGHPADYVRQPIALTGPFTVETWVRLSPRISNADGILGRAGVLDMNFYDATFRVWVAAQRDIVVAKRKAVPDAWTHCAVTRDKEGRFRIYLDGEFSAESTQKNTEEFSGLQIGRSNPADTGTDGSLTEYRVWNVARTSTQIRDNFDRSFSGEELPDGLIHYFDGSDWGKMNGKAHVESTLQAPKLLSAEQAKRQRELFAKYRQLAMQPGDTTAGKALFTKACLVCHQLGGTGGKIGPPLDGVGLTGTEALLRNVLTPSIAMEGGYRNFRVLTKNGRIVQGLLVSQDTEAVVLRLPDTADRRIEKSVIDRAGFTSLSVMPNGLLDTMTPQDVSNLFTHLHSLTQKGTPVDNAASSIRNTERHSVFVAGPDFTGILDEDGRELWNAGRPGARDGFVLPNENVLIAWSDEVKELTRELDIVFHYRLSADNAEIGTAQRLENGNTLVTELGRKPRLLEVADDGSIVVECPLQPETDNAHMQTRMARKLPNGNYLVPHLAAFKVNEYAPDGRIVREIKTDLPALGGRAAENWPFTAILLKNGNLLISLTHGNKCVEFSSDGKIVWQVSNDDLPGSPLVDPCGVQRLKNGNTVIASYGAKKGIRILEVTPEKQIVWQYSGKHRAHEIQVLTTNGKQEPRPALK